MEQLHGILRGIPTSPSNVVKAAEFLISPDNSVLLPSVPSLFVGECRTFSTFQQRLDLLAALAFTHKRLLQSQTGLEVLFASELGISLKNAVVQILPLILELLPSNDRKVQILNILQTFQSDIGLDPVTYTSLLDIITSQKPFSVSIDSSSSPTSEEPTSCVPQVTPRSTQASIHIPGLGGPSVPLITTTQSPPQTTFPQPSVQAISYPTSYPPTLNLDLCSPGDLVVYLNHTMPQPTAPYYAQETIPIAENRDESLLRNEIQDIFERYQNEIQDLEATLKTSSKAPPKPSRSEAPYSARSQSRTSSRAAWLEIKNQYLMNAMRKYDQSAVPSHPTAAVGAGVDAAGSVDMRTDSVMDVLPPAEWRNFSSRSTEFSGLGYHNG